jgi:hypothetical protein
MVRCPARRNPTLGYNSIIRDERDSRSSWIGWFDGLTRELYQRSPISRYASERPWHLRVEIDSQLPGQILLRLMRVVVQVPKFDAKPASRAWC